MSRNNYHIYMTTLTAAKISLLLEKPITSLQLEGGRSVLPSQCSPFLPSVLWISHFRDAVIPKRQEREVRQEESE